MDQYDPANSVCAELMFRRLQAIEYCYAHKLRDKASQNVKGGLAADELAAFGAAARAESKLMICPDILEQAKVQMEKEASLLKSIQKAREAKVAIHKAPPAKG